MGRREDAMKWLVAMGLGLAAFWLTQQWQIKWRRRKLRQQWPSASPVRSAPPSVLWQIHWKVIEGISKHWKKKECPMPLRFLQSWLVGAGLDVSVAWDVLVPFQILLWA